MSEIKQQREERKRDPIPVILDMDPGHDDAIALLLAAASPELDIKGITVVAGNQTLEKTVRNALVTMTVGGISGIPVAAGASKPLARPLTIADHVHGETGLEGPAVPEPAMEPDPRHAVDLMADILKETDPGHPVTLIPTGPLTNVALLLRMYPTLATERIERIVLMGGGVTEGNITPAAEFNIYVDPEAAKVVFDFPLPVVMIGLDVTHQAIVTGEEAGDLRRRGGPVAAFAADLLDYFQQFHDDVYDFGGSPIHDACAVARVIQPELIETEPMNVQVVTAGLTAGQTVCDMWSVTGREPNAEVGLGIDAPSFKEMLFQRLLSYDE